MIASIFAMSENRVIGQNNQLPWHLPADLKFFKATTLNHPILMGRKTFESIGKPLPQRASIIITRQHGYRAEGALVVNSIAEAIKAGQELNPDIFIIGGAEILKEVLPIIDTMYLTRNSMSRNGRKPGGKTTSQTRKINTLTVLSSWKEENKLFCPHKKPRPEKPGLLFSQSPASGPCAGTPELRPPP